MNGKWVLKSGTDFRQMSKVAVTFGVDGKTGVDIQLIEMNKADPEDEEVKAVVQDYLGECRVCITVYYWIKVIVIDW